MHQRKPTNHRLRHCYCVDWPRQNAQPPASPHKGCFQLNTQYYWHKTLRAQKMYLVCLPGFCFSSLSTAILCENECSVAPVIGNQRLESEKKITYQRLRAKGWHPKLVAFALFLELSPGARVNERCKSDQANLSLLRKLNAHMKASVVNTTTISRSIETVRAHARLLRLLVGEGGVKQQENTQSKCSSLLSS